MKNEISEVFHLMKTKIKRYLSYGYENKHNSEDHFDLWSAKFRNKLSKRYFAGVYVDPEAEEVVVKINMKDFDQEALKRGAYTSLNGYCEGFIIKNLKDPMISEIDRFLQNSNAQFVERNWI